MTTAISIKWTLDDYHRMINAGILAKCRVELLYGEIVEMVCEGTPHFYYSDESKYASRQDTDERSDSSAGLSRY